LDRSLAENERLQQEIARLEKLIEETLRQKKRNPAPFSRGEPKANPQTPGRKAGKQ
jgi:hypothetical protein